MMNRTTLFVAIAFIIYTIVGVTNATGQPEKLKYLANDLADAITLLDESQAQADLDLNSQCDTLNDDNTRAVLVFPKLESIGFLFGKNVVGRGFTFLPVVNADDSQKPKQWRLAWYQEYRLGGPGLSLGIRNSYCFKGIIKDHDMDENQSPYDYIFSRGNIYLSNNLSVSLIGELSAQIDHINEELDCGSNGPFIGAFTVGSPEYDVLHNFETHKLETTEYAAERLLVENLECALNSYCSNAKSCPPESMEDEQ